MNNLTRTYLIALTIIALVIAFSQFLVQNSISQSSSDSRTINISGRQRMLSQKITKASLAMHTAKTEKQFLNRKRELRTAYDLWASSHLALQYGDEQMELVDVNNSKVILELFNEVKPFYESIDDAANQILQTRSLEETSSATFEAGLQQILANEGQFLKLMNDITFEYDAESSSRTKALSVTEYILFLVAFLLLIVEGAFIFRPAIKKISDYTKQIQDSLKKEEYLNNQANSIFENVKQGIFLIDEDLKISELYSKETDQIFETKNLQNTKFLKLMRPRLVGRDLDALEMFVEHLFNPKIRESVVNRLNPVEYVEIYPDKASESMDPRHIRMSFSRIMKGGKIHRVMVTVIDETEVVVMKKQIEEAETQNEENYFQLMSILKIHPENLNSFLKDSLKSLGEISLRYEDKNYLSLIELVQHTYQVVHCVKGNASLIGLELIANALHKVEDSIVELKAKPLIEGKHLLKIIYQITEVTTSLSNMLELQDKIATIYEGANQSSKNDTSSTLKIKEAVVSGLEKIAKDNNKKVRLDFKDSVVNMPEYYESSMKDIASQLIRNSLTHGIESPEDRKLNHKPETGMIKIALLEQEDYYTLDYSDDGNGLDIKKILSKAVKNDLIKKEDIPNMVAKDVVDLIFENDFSTHMTVDKYAGRGQGMPLIKSLIEKYEGKYKIGFKKGQNFKIQISFPKTSRVIAA